MFSKNTKEVCVLLKISLFPHCLQDKMKMPSTAGCFPGSQPPSPGLSILNLAPFPSDTLCPASPRPQELLPVLGASLPHHLPCCPAPLTHRHQPKGSFKPKPFCSSTTSCSLFRLLRERTKLTFCADRLSSSLFPELLEARSLYFTCVLSM